MQISEIRWWVQRMARIIWHEGYRDLLHAHTNQALQLKPADLLTTGDKMYLDAKFHVALFLRRGDLVLPYVNPPKDAPPGSGLVPEALTW